MVYTIIGGKFGVFLEAFFISVCLLMIGFFIGFYIEYARTNEMMNNYQNFEVESLDLKLQNYYFQIMNQSSCSEAIKQNFIFADKIYNVGLKLEKYEETSELTKALIIEKKKYVLMKNELWMNSQLLKSKCKIPFDTVVYFYSQNTNTMKDAEQSSLSSVLRDVKNEMGNNIVLIPMAGDMGLDSIDMQMRIYNVTYLPSLVINEKVKLEGFRTKEEVEKYLE